VAILWIFLRSAAGVGAAGLGVPYPEALLGPPITVLWLTVAIILAVRVEMSRRREGIFLENLGHSFAPIATVVAAETSLLELALRLAVG
jgi:hypothetical protein